jgi:long-chain fatty acid transport protein
MRYPTRYWTGCCFRLPCAFLCAAFLGVIFSMPSPTSAQGIFLTGVGPINQGMGGAAVAAPLDSAGALAWNPATISGLKSSEMAVALGLLLPTTTLSSQAFGLSGTTQGEPGATPIPTMSFVLKDNCSPWSWGVGVFGVGGFSTNFPGSSLANPATANPILTPQPPAGVGVGPVFSRAEIYQVIPTVSYAVTEKFSVGIAPTIDLANVQANPLIFAPPNVVAGVPSYGPGADTRYAWGIGVQAGAYYITDYNWRLGLSYKSTQWFEPLRFNSSDILGNPVLDKVKFDLPSITSIGASYTGFDRLLYAVDFRWFDYANAAGFNGSGFRPDGSVAGLGWKSVFGVANGLQYTATDRLSLRCGYTYINNPIRGSQEQFNIATSLMMQHFLALGASYQIRQNIGANIAYTHGFQSSLTGPYVVPAGPVPGTSITSINSVDHLTAGVTVQF